LVVGDGKGLEQEIIKNLALNGVSRITIVPFTLITNIEGLMFKNGQNEICSHLDIIEHASHLNPSVLIQPGDIDEIEQHDFIILINIFNRHQLVQDAIFAQSFKRLGSS